MWGGITSTVPASAQQQYMKNLTARQLALLVQHLASDTAQATSLRVQGERLVSYTINSDTQEEMRLSSSIKIAVLLWNSNAGSRVVVVGDNGSLVDIRRGNNASSDTLEQVEGDGIHVHVVRVFGSCNDLAQYIAMILLDSLSCVITWTNGDAGHEQEEAPIEYDEYDEILDAILNKYKQTGDIMLSGTETYVMSNVLSRISMRVHEGDSDKKALCRIYEHIQSLI